MELLELDSIVSHISQQRGNLGGDWAGVNLDSPNA